MDLPLSTHCNTHTCREKPLAVYAFTKNSADKEKIATRTSSGGVVFNDIMVQFAGEYNTHTHTHTHTQINYIHVPYTYVHT